MLFWLAFCLVQIMLPDQSLADSFDPFSIIVLPDTQHYTTPGKKGSPEMFTSQTQWIVENRDTMNIVIVLHEGDITNDNDDPGWINAKQSLGILDGKVPYVLAVGNHDGLMTKVNNTDKFNTYFPVSQFEGLPTFGGVFEPGRMDNSYHFFHAGGVDWLVLSLEFGPRDAVLEWADEVVASHPGHEVIVLTHSHLYSDGKLHGSLPGHHWLPSFRGRENNGIDAWNKLLRKHANIVFVFSGHVLNGGQGRVVGKGESGNKVYQMLCNYQMEKKGGNGFLRIIRFIPEEDRLVASSYSPYSGEYKTDHKNQFEYDMLGIFVNEPPAAVETLQTARIDTGPPPGRAGSLGGQSVLPSWPRAPYGPWSVRQPKSPVALLATWQDGARH